MATLSHAPVSGKRQRAVSGNVLDHSAIRAAPAEGVPGVTKACQGIIRDDNAECFTCSVIFIWVFSLYSLTSIRSKVVSTLQYCENVYVHICKHQSDITSPPLIARPNQ